MQQNLLAAARKARDAAKEQLAQGIDPGKARKAEKAMPRDELPAFLRQLEAYDGEVATRLALRPIILTMVRTKELRGAEWREFEDLGGNALLWRIPASRMKMPPEHPVPLPHQAVAILDVLRPLTGYSIYLFPSGGKKGGMSENTMLYALYRMGHHFPRNRSRFPGRRLYRFERERIPPRLDRAAVGAR